MGDDQKLAIGAAMMYLTNARVIANLIYSGLLERNPELQLVSVESGIGWIPFLLESLDHQLDETAPGTMDHLSMMPSEYFRRQMYACFWFEQHDVADDDRAASASTTSCSRPTSRTRRASTPTACEHVARSLDGVAPDVTRKVLQDNAAGLYRIELAAPDPWAATSSASTCSSTRRCSAGRRRSRSRSPPHATPASGSSDSTSSRSTRAGLAPGEARTLLDRHGVRCFEMLGLVVNASDDETLEGARRAAHWVGETGADWVLTVVDSPVDDALVDRFARCGRPGAGRGRAARARVPPVHGGVDDRRGPGRVRRRRPRSGAGVLVDSWHVFRGTDSLADVAAMPGDAIAYVQFDDALPLVGEPADEVMARRVWPGAGEFPLAGFAEAIRGDRLLRAR